MKNTAVFLLTVAVAILTFMVVRGSRTAQQARVALAAAIDERDSLRDRVAELEAAQHTLAEQVANLRAPSPEPSGKNATNTAAIARPGTAVRARVGPAEVFDSPEMRRLMALQQKAHLDLRYAALFAALRLPADKLEQFRQLLVDRQNAGMDVLAAARRHPESGLDIEALMRREHANIDTAIRDLLGDTAFEEYQDFERTQLERSMVDQLARRLSYGDAPLTNEQAEALVDLLSAQRRTQQPVPPSGIAGARFTMGVQTGVADPAMGMVFGGPPLLNETTLEAASSVLTETQLAALRELQAAQDAQRQIGELLRRSMPAGENAHTVMIGPDAVIGAAPVAP